MSKRDKGSLGEERIANFFDTHFSRLFSFPSPKTQANVEIADVLVWWNRVVLLVEVKTRDTSKATVDQWARSCIQKAVAQIDSNMRRIRNRETINLRNRFFHPTLMYEGLDEFVGMVVLVADGPLTLRPTDAVPDIYQRDTPIHVFSWSDLKRMPLEIDTVPDLMYYLGDRHRYLQQGHDIPLGCEMNVVGNYKMRTNAFPDTATDFVSTDFWREYQSVKTDEIAARAEHNKNADTFDRIADMLPERRTLYDGLPTGLYFSWELAALSRRQRAYCGEKLLLVPTAFAKGNPSRQFAPQWGLSCS